MVNQPTTQKIDIPDMSIYIYIYVKYYNYPLQLLQQIPPKKKKNHRSSSRSSTVGSDQILIQSAAGFGASLETTLSGWFASFEQKKPC